MRVYPRVCGGTALDMAVKTDIHGLSPRVRGNLMAAVLEAVAAGSIPACAGEPKSCPLQSRTIRVYPRVCGGTGCGSGRHTGPPGLSPRVRGNPDDRHPAPAAQRSIPACAGEPSSLWSSLRIESGLSPRVRGNLINKNRDAGVYRSIPACAGEPDIHAAPPLTPTVYPRVCGGTAHVPQAVDAHAGLSPRVRGNPEAKAVGVALQGSIPACAGEPGN